MFSPETSFKSTTNITTPFSTGADVTSVMSTVGETSSIKAEDSFQQQRSQRSPILERISENQVEQNSSSQDMNASPKPNHSRSPDAHAESPRRTDEKKGDFGSTSKTSDELSDELKIKEEPSKQNGSESSKTKWHNGESAERTFAEKGAARSDENGPREAKPFGAQIASNASKNLVSSDTSSSGSDLSGSAQSSQSTSPTLFAKSTTESPIKRPAPVDLNGHGSHHPINVHQELKSKLISKKENQINSFGEAGFEDALRQHNQHLLNNQMLNYMKQHQKPTAAKLPLAQSVSVPRLHSHSKAFDGAHNAHHFHNSHNVPNDLHVFPKDIMSSTATFLPPTMSNNASLEVKLKLKNTILQKLDRDKTNNLSGSFMSSSSSAHGMDFNRNPHKITDPQNHYNMLLRDERMNNPEHLSAFLQYGQLQGLIEQYNAALMNRSLKDSEDNLLRRTTSEPNLKVKSALKATLLTKRNQLHPFNFKRENKPGLSANIAQNHAQTSPKQPQDFRFNHLSSPKDFMSKLPSKYPNFMDQSGAEPSSEGFMLSNSNSHINPAHQIPMMPIDLMRAGLGGARSNQMDESDDAAMRESSRPDFDLYSKHRSMLGRDPLKKDDEPLKPNLLMDITASAENKLFNPKSISMSSFPGGINPYSNLGMITSWQQQLAASQQLDASNSLKANQLYDYLALATAPATSQSNPNDKSAFFGQPRDPSLLAGQLNQFYPLNVQDYQNLFLNSHFNKTVQASMSFPTLHSNQTGASSEYSSAYDQLKKSKNPIPKFGHMAHVEEDNEMLLTNELQTELNKSMVYGKEAAENDEDDDELPQERGDANELLRKKLLEEYESLLKKNADPYKYSENQDLLTLRLQEILQRSNERQKLELLQYQQELEEQIRQQQFLANKNSYFSDPHLLKSLETTSISNPDSPSSSSGLLLGLKHKNENMFFKNLGILSENKMLFSTPDHPPSHSRTSPLAKSSLAAMDISMNHDDRVYRYTTGIVYDAAMLKHECTCNNSNNHLETPDRLRAIWTRIRSLNLDSECEIVTTKIASIGDLLMCHNEQYALIFGTEKEYRFKLPKEYLQFYMMNICLAPCNGFALASDIDNSWNEQNTPTACRVAIGSSYELANLVWHGKLKNGFALVRPPGSHAEFNKPSGFCYFNTTAIVAKMLKKNLLLERILIVDWDVHHGNGTQQLTYNDPNILYLSLHRHDDGSFFPGTGSIDECGQEGSMGKNVNIAWNSNLNPPMGDVEYLAAFRCCVMPIARSFDPQIILVSSGFDGTENHPRELGGYKISPACFGYMTKMLMSLADGKVVLILEGGYDLNSLADCSENCVKALLGQNISPFADEVLNALPNETAINDLNAVIDVQKSYWPVLESAYKYVKMSHRQYVQMFSD